MINPEDVLGKIKEVLSDGEKVKDFKFFLSGGKRGGGSRIYLTVRTNRRDLFTKYDPHGKFAAFKNEYTALEKVASMDFSIPKPIAVLDRGILISKIEGVPLEEIVGQKGLRKMGKVLNDAIVRIAAFHKKYVFRPNIKERAKIYKEITGENRYGRMQKEFNRSSIGFAHGDLDPFNMLYDLKTSEFGLIDWENFNMRGSQELDVLHFVVMLAVIVNPGISHAELYGILFKKYKKNPYRTLLARYCKERNIVLASVLALIPVYCDTQNYRLIRAKRSTSGFLYTDFKELYYGKQ